MLSITNSTIEKEAYFFGTFLMDVAVGAITSIAIIPVALLLGGFSLFASWLIVTSLLMFAAGMLRGNSAGNIWLKGVSMNAGCFLLGIMLLHSTTAVTFPLAMLTTVLLTSAGVSFRRYRLLRSTESKIGTQR